MARKKPISNIDLIRCKKITWSHSLRTLVMIKICILNWRRKKNWEFSLKNHIKIYSAKSRGMRDITQLTWTINLGKNCSEGGNFQRELSNKKDQMTNWCKMMNQESLSVLKLPKGIKRRQSKLDMEIKKNHRPHKKEFLLTRPTNTKKNTKSKNVMWKKRKNYQMRIIIWT